jgi:hypothetical protein
VVLGKEGDVKWIYQGHPQINTEDKLFDPRDSFLFSPNTTIFLQLLSVGHMSVSPTSTTPSIMSLLFVTWIPVGRNGDNERNGLICPDCVISLTSELSTIEIRMSLHFVSVTNVNKDYSLSHTESQITIVI